MRKKPVGKNIFTDIYSVIETQKDRTRIEKGQELIEAIENRKNAKSKPNIEH